MSKEIISVRIGDFIITADDEDDPEALRLNGFPIGSWSDVAAVGQPLTKEELQKWVHQFPEEFWSELLG